MTKTHVEKAADDESKDILINVNKTEKTILQI